MRFSNILALAATFIGKLIHRARSDSRITNSYLQLQVQQQLGTEKSVGLNTYMGRVRQAATACIAAVGLKVEHVVVLGAVWKDACNSFASFARMSIC